MRQYCLIVWLVLLATPAIAGKRDEASLGRAVEELDRALERKDTIVLKSLLGEKLEYGHSNGWVETKAELISDLFNGKLTYKAITLNGKQPSILIEGKTGLVREEITVDILFDGRPLNMKLSVLQVWTFQAGKWILLGRQSTKV